MDAKRLVPILLTALVITVQNTSACTIFVLTDAKRVVFCNNEDWSNPKSRIWFVPAGDGHLGCAFVGFDNGCAQGGLNTKGLAFDWVAGSMEEWKPGAEMKVTRGLPSMRMLETCTTVEEAIAFFRIYREPSFAYARILIADSSGKSVIVGARKGKLQIEESGQCRGFGYGQRTLDKMLAMTPEPTATNGAGILRACLQNGTNSTKYSNIFDLKSGDIHIFQPPIRSEGVTLNLAGELKKGEHYYDIPHISEQVSQPPMPLLNNMKRLFVDQFKPIPDTEPAVTGRIGAILQDLLDGKARIDDYTAEFWKEVKHDEVRAITEFKMLGKIASLTLVDRKPEGGNSGYRYLAKFEDVMPMELQVRFVLDQENKVVLVELEGIQWK
jgi:hypothetical protein